MNRNAQIAPVSNPDDVPAGWRCAPPWRWARTPDEVHDGCLRVRMPAAVRGVFDAVCAWVWGPDRVEATRGHRYTVRELAHVTGLHRTTVERSLDWCLCRGILAREDAGGELGTWDGSFRYAVRAPELWTRAPSVEPGDPGFPRRAERPPRPVALVETERDTETLEPGGVSRAAVPASVVETAPNRLDEPRDAGGAGVTRPDAPEAPDAPPGPPGGVISVGLHGGARVLVFPPRRAVDGPPSVAAELSTSGRGRSRASLPADQTSINSDRFHGSGERSSEGANGANSGGAQRRAAAASWYVRGPSGIVPLYAAIEIEARRAGEGVWSAIRRRGRCTPDEAIELSDRLAAAYGGQRWAASAVLDASAVAVSRADELDALAVAERIRARRAAAAALRRRLDELGDRLAPRFELDDARAAVAALDPAHAEADLLAAVAAERLDALEAARSRSLAAAELAAAEARRVEAARLAELAAAADTLATAALVEQLGDALAWYRDNPTIRRSTLPGWADAVAEARAREIERLARLRWRIASGAATRDERGEAIATLRRIEIRRGRKGPPGDAGPPPAADVAHRERPE